jgi:hypothetical protein
VSYDPMREEWREVNGVDILASLDQGKYVSSDVAETLSAFMVNSMPDHIGMDASEHDEDKWSWEELNFLIVLRAVFQFGRGPHSGAVAAYLTTESLDFIWVGVTVTSVSVATAQGPLASLRVWRRFIG